MISAPWNSSCPTLSINITPHPCRQQSWVAHIVTHTAKVTAANRNRKNTGVVCIGTWLPWNEQTFNFVYWDQRESCWISYNNFVTFGCMPFWNTSLSLLFWNVRMFYSASSQLVLSSPLCRMPWSVAEMHKGNERGYNENWKLWVSRQWKRSEKGFWFCLTSDLNSWTRGRRPPILSMRVLLS